MLKDPSTKYKPAAIIDLPTRTWPNQTISQAPIWLSTDLRDGNQALFNPMSVASKLKLFNELVQVGFKEIEVGFPSASEIDYNFVRLLIEQDLIPEDVTIMVISQARQDLIDKTVAAVNGCKNVIVHLYNATAPAWRELVFAMTVPQVIDLVAMQVSYLKEITSQQTETNWILQYSPETFSATELDVALDVCNAAIWAWGTNQERQIIINLPSTVENTTPNVFADRIEWMSMRLSHREHMILSVHPHNDRGTGVATAELALLAGAQRIEGCLFGNGERSGNVDLVTLALNLYTQGISPELDFSNINRVAKIVEDVTQLQIHPRHPYAGDLVFTAFSGSHQDAIKKGFAQQSSNPSWNVPYLPIDPSDLGRSYDNIIRINSQSGKGGIAYLLETNYGISIPRRMQVEFSNIIQKTADASEREMAAEEIWQLFNQTYLNCTHESEPVINYLSHQLESSANAQEITLHLVVDGESFYPHGCGNGPLDAAVKALGNLLQINSYEEKSIGSGASAQAISLIECYEPANNLTKFGAGQHSDIVVASLLALLNVSQRLGLTSEMLHKWRSAELLLVS